MRGTDVVALLVTRKTMKVQNEANTSIHHIKPAHTSLVGMRIVVRNGADC